MAGRALIFGCTGQDGSYLAKSLLEKNFSLAGISRTCHMHVPVANHQELNIDKDINIIQVKEVTVQETIHLLEKFYPEEIYYLAGQSSVGLSFQTPLKTIVSIVDGTRNILEASRLIGFKGKIFFAGSGEIYGNTIKAANLDSQNSPKSPYAVAKLESMFLVKLYREVYQINCKTGVLFNHESKLRNKNFFMHKLINGAIECTLNKNKKIKLGNLKIQRDWGAAEEYVEAMQVINRSRQNHDHIICTGFLTSLEEIVEKVFYFLNLDWKEHIIIDTNLFRHSDVEKSFGDPSPLYKELKWKATHNLDSLLMSLINSYKNN